MKKAFILVLLILCIGGCSTHRKIDRKTVSITTDSTRVRRAEMALHYADSLEQSIRKQVTETRTANTTVIERGPIETQPYTITAAFTLDTSVKGDTLRLVDQENDDVKVQVYYDKTSKRAVAQIQGKGRDIKTPFEKITITNASMSKNTDSAASLKAGSSATMVTKMNDSGSIKTVANSTSKNKETTSKPAWMGILMWGGFALVIIAAIYYGWKVLIPKIISKWK